MIENAESPFHVCSPIIIISKKKNHSIKSDWKSYNENINFYMNNDLQINPKNDLKYEFSNFITLKNYPRNDISTVNNINLSDNVKSHKNLDRKFSSEVEQQNNFDDKRVKYINDLNDDNELYKYYEKLGHLDSNKIDKKSILNKYLQISFYNNRSISNNIKRKSLRNPDLHSNLLNSIFRAMYISS